MVALPPVTLETFTGWPRVLEAAVRLSQEGIEAGVLHVGTLKPLDREAVLSLAAKTGRLVTVENHLVAGGLGTAVAELLSEELPTPLKRVGLEDRFASPGTPDYLFGRHGLDGPGVVAAVKGHLGVIPDETKGAP